MEKASEKRICSGGILTIPNLLSLFRIALIPLIIFLYSTESYVASGVVLIISGITDILDGIIARRFNMITDLGKVLDPIADKTTQIIVALLLISHFPMMILPLALGIAKESFMAISGYAIVKRRGIVPGACWHGKAATVLLTVTMVIHLIWNRIPQDLSTVLISISAAMTVVSFALYTFRNIGLLTK